MEREVLEPQPGYQMKAITSSADILIGGGSAGCGKTFSLLFDPLRYVSVKGFGGVIFRRTSTQIKSQGGLWDASNDLYKKLPETYPVESKLTWYFGQHKTKIKFSHLEYEKNKYDWQGSEIPFIGFDELTHFTKSMFFYLLSRNRSTCGVQPVVRATCNPDPDSWVKDFIGWWIGEDGFPIEERSGVLRYFFMHNDNYVWGESKEDVYNKANHILDDMIIKAKEKGVILSVNDFIKSVTFVSGSIYENQKLLTADPSYLGSLNALPEEEKNRLLDGNWEIKHNKRDIYEYATFKSMFTNHYLRDRYADSQKRITSDIAGKGSDYFVVFVWQGKMMIDFEVYSHNKGNEIIDVINNLAYKHEVSNHNISFDNDGLGWFVDGFIEDAKEFTNNSRARNGENYKNLKSQCFYKSGDAVKRGEYYIPEEIANRPFNDTRTLKEQLMYERKAIKRDKADMDGKLCVIPKKEMKTYLQSKSPDCLDAFSQLEFHYLEDDYLEIEIENDF